MMHRSRLVKYLIIKLALIFSMGKLNAQMVSNATTGAVSRPYKFSLGSTLNSSLHRSEVEHALSNTFSFGASYSIDKIGKISVSELLDKDLKNDRQETWSDPVVSFSRAIYTFNDVFSLSGKIASSIPASEESRDNVSLITTTTIQPVLAADFSNTIKGLAVTYIPSFKRSFHQFETKADGSSNTAYSYSQRLIVDYTFLESFTLSLDQSYIRGYTYRGASKDSFNFDQSINYQMNKTVAWSLGHSLGGSALAVNGQDSNVRLFDKNESQVYFGLSLSL